MEGIMAVSIVKLSVENVNEIENKTKHHELLLMVIYPGK